MKRVSNTPVFERRDARRSIRFALHMQKAIGSRDNMIDAFEELRVLVRARSVLHVRQTLGARDCVSAARGDPSAGKLFPRPPRSYASIILGEHLHAAKPGKVWFASDVELDIDTRESLRHAGIGDVAILPLENTPAHSDFFEIEFVERVPIHDRALLEMLCPLIAEAWQARDPGAAQAMMRGRPSRVARESMPDEEKPILHADNPAGLTRSEFQVCYLIHEGRMPESIAETLHVKKSTLRSHMRSIYQKTGVSGQVELVHRLHGAVASGSNRH